ncbi:hypothetical protein [Nodularia sp. UHCC 0506]|uniref:hypothetical protein n=1 Tax=Nodularia sp. UHCC 0506 TaxID=3110243 RepID=UPI002B1E9A4F|nr:hypothetical protein [Nodularia sp. UHCC 0506]MEA5516719.1 hypothetical protein [Nodularia sp. UHCC 0506]
MLIAQSLDVGTGLQICSITNNNLNKPAPTLFLLRTFFTQHSALRTQNFLHSELRTFFTQHSALSTQHSELRTFFTGGI